MAAEEASSGDDDLGQERRVLAVHELAMQGIPVTHGLAKTLKSSTFQAHACPVTNQGEVDWVVDHLYSTRPWSNCSALSFAYRLGDEETDEGDPDQDPQDLDCGCEDGGDHGAGERLLFLLERWQVLNVCVLVTRVDNKGLLQHMGAQRHRVVVSLAKEVLEQCYVESVTEQQEAEAAIAAAKAKLQALEAQRKLPSGGGGGGGGGGDYLSMSRGPGGPAEDHILRAPPKPRATLRAAQCTLEPETVEWPAGHVPAMFGGHPQTKGGRTGYFQGALSSDAVDPNASVRSPMAAKPVVLTERGALPPRDSLAGDRAVGLVAPPVVTQSTLSQLKLVHMPDEDVRLVLQLVALVVYGHRKPLTWRRLKELVAEPVFLGDCHAITPATLGVENAEQLRRYLEHDALSPHSLQRRLPLVAELLRWLTQLLQLHDFLTTGLPPPDMAFGPSGATAAPYSSASVSELRQEMVVPHLDLLTGFGSMAKLTSPSSRAR